MMERKNDFRNTVDMFRTLAEDYGHLWANGDPEDWRVAGLEEVIKNTEDFGIAHEAAKELSDRVFEIVKDYPAPHNTGIPFPTDLYHRTETGREVWFSVHDDYIVYEIHRPCGVIVQMAIFKDRTVETTFLSLDNLCERHCFPIIDSLLSLGVSPEDMPNFIPKIAWINYLSYLAGGN